MDFVSSEVSTTVSSPSIRRSSASVLYFGFGSNLLGSRLRLSCPGLKLIGVGRLPGHRLVFNGWSDNWQGAVANIVPVHQELKINDEFPHNPPLTDHENYVWGAVWQIPNIDVPALDKQEGVELGEYEAVMKELELYRNDEIKNEYCKALQKFEITSDGDDAGDLVKLCSLINQIAQNKRSSLSSVLPEKVLVRTYRKGANSVLFPQNDVMGFPSATYKLVIMKGAIEVELPFHYLQMLSALNTNRNISTFRSWRNKMQ